AYAGRLDVFSRKSVTNKVQTAGTDYAPKEPDSQHAGERKSDHRADVDAEQMRPTRREDPDQARADQPTRDDHCDDEPVEDDVQSVQQVVESLVDEAHLDLPVADLLQKVVHLEGHLRHDLREAQRLLARTMCELPRPE